VSRRYVALCGLLSWAIACDAKRDDDAEQSAAVDTAVPPPADTLVGTAPGGVEIWFTLSREGVAADGSHCIDRTIEIRRGGSRVQVPLLYTGAVPELVNDSTIRARLSNRCAPGDAYLVDLRSGRPVRER
jgi:hypothetical protein